MEKQIKKVIALLFLVKRESEKILCQVLAVIEQLFRSNIKEFPELKIHLKEIVSKEIELTSEKGSEFEVVWLIFFSRFVGLGITNFNDLVDNSLVKENEFYKSILTSKQTIFSESGIKLFRKPSACKDESLAQHLAVFKR